MLVFIEDGRGGRAETVLGPWDCVSCPAERHPRLHQRGPRARVSPGDAGQGQARPHDLRRRVASVPSRRAPRGAAALLARRPPVLVGASPKRKEDARFITGRGRYLDDISMPALLHLALVRSPHAHARVARIDGAAARALDGVVAVLTRADMPELAALGAAAGSRAQGARRISTPFSPRARCAMSASRWPSWWPTDRVPGRGRGRARRRGLRGAAVRRHAPKRPPRRAPRG